MRCVEEIKDRAVFELYNGRYLQALVCYLLYIYMNITVFVVKHMHIYMNVVDTHNIIFFGNNFLFIIIIFSPFIGYWLFHNW